MFFIYKYLKVNNSKNGRKETVKEDKTKDEIVKILIICFLCYFQIAFLEKNIENSEKKLAKL